MHLSFPAPCGVGFVIVPTLQMRKLKTAQQCLSSEEAEPGVRGLPACLTPAPACLCCTHSAMSEPRWEEIQRGEREAKSQPGTHSP